MQPSRLAGGSARGLAPGTRRPFRQPGVPATAGTPCRRRPAPVTEMVGGSTGSARAAYRGGVKIPDCRSAGYSVRGRHLLVSQTRLPSAPSVQVAMPSWSPTQRLAPLGAAKGADGSWARIRSHSGSVCRLLMAKPSSGMPGHAAASMAGQVSCTQARLATIHRPSCSSHSSISSVDPPKTGTKKPLRRLAPLHPHGPGRQPVIALAQIPVKLQRADSPPFVQARHADRRRAVITPYIAEDPTLRNRRVGLLFGLHLDEYPARQELLEVRQP